MSSARSLRSGWALALAAALGASAPPAHASGAIGEDAPPAGAAAASLDLATREGAAQAKATWRYADARIVPTQHRAPDADGQPTGAPTQTWTVEPRAGGVDFDDASWPAIDATSLAQRRGPGRLAFGWYRVRVTVPARIGDFDPTGSTLVLETTLDDYAEIWIDGALPRSLGQRGGSVVAGWNAPNRLVIAHDAKPGQQIQLAIFGANGPLSDPPANFLWIRGARLDFYREDARGPHAFPPREVNVEIERKDPGLDAIVPANPKLFELAEGFQFTEGPIWLAREQALLFSDPNHNTIYRYGSDGALRVFREPSGYEGTDVAEYGQPGSNGLTLDRAGRLTIDQHGNRRVVRVETDGTLTVLADRYEGKRLNSPNDLVYRSDGTLFFTDPPFGLPKFYDDSRKELPYSGVFRWRDGELRLVSQELRGPNGIAFTPDEKQLYVGNWDEKKKVVMRYDVAPDGSLSNGRVFFDMTQAPGEDAIDGVKVDQRGNVYVSGPGGLWVLSPQGKHLGTIRGPKHAHNFAWGDDDGRTLYLCARGSLYRMKLLVQGVRP